MDQSLQKDILNRYLNGQASETEKALVDQWILVGLDQHYEMTDEELLADLTEVRLRLGLAEQKSPFYKLWPRIGIAAAMIVVVFSVGLFYFSKWSVKTEPTMASVNDISPAKNGATLILSNGQKILIKDALAGKIASQSGVKISKAADGQILYEMTGGNSGGLEFNTLSTTRGEQTKLRLPDGTLVFLNAGSSLRYPVSFSRLDKRQVALTGEAYFEVVHNKAKPFVVSSRGQEIKVLGTHFNINAYFDEQSVRTTLLQGSVRIDVKDKFGILKPGEQSSVKGDMLVIQKANIEKVMAWKNGYFSFNDENIENVMRELCRWYNVDVEYEGEISIERFDGKISRLNNISAVLNALESTNAIHFKVEGRRVIVRQ